MNTNSNNQKGNSLLITIFIVLILVLIFVSGDSKIRRWSLPKFIDNVTAASITASDDFESGVVNSAKWNVWTCNCSTSTSVKTNSQGGKDLARTSTQWAGLSWTANTFSADQFSEIQLSPDWNPNALIQVYVRRRASDLARYALHYNPENGLNQWQIKYDGVPTPQVRIVATNSSYPSPKAGDSIRIEITGSNPPTIKGFHKCAGCSNFTEVASTVDSNASAINTPGPPGIVSRDRVDIPANVTYPALLVSNWNGGELANPSPSSSNPISGPIVPSSSPLKIGDISGITGSPDNKVDIWDYNLILTDFGKTGSGLVADIEQSGTSLNKIDIFDYNLLLTNFGL